jgi:RNA polymerase sigma-70 factor, ECF subfamily
MTPAVCDPTEEKQQVADWVREAQEGDREAFGRLVARFERSVYSTAYKRLGNHAETQEVTQEVFVQALRKLRQLREPEAFIGWLRAIANRMAINRAVRRATPVATQYELLEGRSVEHDTPLVKALERERAAQVQSGLARLGQLDRETLVAFYVEGHSLIEMSNAFESPVGTIKRRLHVARKRLARELGGLAAS